MIELFVAFALGAASSGAAFFVADRASKAERAKLMDRVMARDWESYVVARRAEMQLPARPQPTDPEEEALRESSNGLL